MSIELITGAPGNGKTLYAIWMIENRRKKENREVYYSGITDLKLPWIEFADPAQWPELPIGSMIVIDEAQRLFRPRALAKEVPVYVSALETHRHKGMDIFLITQHPTLIDTNVRRLAETHYHLMRKFGAKWATVHSWKGVKENCDKTRKDSQSFEFKYPKEVFKWYKSAEVHTVKFRLPLKVMVFMILPLIIIAAIWYVVTMLKAKHEASTVPASVPVGTTVRAEDGRYYPPGTALDLYKSMIPRIPDLLHTAPRYDSLTAPVRVPVIVGCWRQGQHPAIDAPFRDRVGKHRLC